MHLVFFSGFAPRSAVVSCHARDGVRWMCPVVGCRSSAVRARGPHSGQERLHTVVNRVHDRAPQSGRLGRRQGLQSGPPTMFPHCGESQSTSRSRFYGSAEAGGSHRGVGRDESTRQTAEGRIASRQVQVQSSASGAQDRGMQDVYRTCHAPRCSRKMFMWRRSRMPSEGCCSCRRRRWLPHIVQVSQRSVSGEGTQSVVPDSLQAIAKAVAGRVAQR